MGTSIAMIDRHYGHLANDSRDHAVALPDALRAGGGRWVDVDPHAPQANQEEGCGLSNTPVTPSRGRPVDAAPRDSRRHR
jgi:hypothetical protein